VTVGDIAEQLSEAVLPAVVAEPRPSAVDGWPVFEGTAPCVGVQARSRIVIGDTMQTASTERG